MCGIASIAVQPEHSLPDGVRQRSDLQAGRVHWSRLWALIALGAIG